MTNTEKQPGVKSDNVHITDDNTIELTLNNKKTHILEVITPTDGQQVWLIATFGQIRLGLETFSDGGMDIDDASHFCNLLLDFINTMMEKDKHAKLIDTALRKGKIGLLELAAVATSAFTIIQRNGDNVGEK